jgi:hypothetical protein
MRRPVLAMLLVAAMALAVAPADAATLRAARFTPPTLTVRWALESGDCASLVSISPNPKVDSYGYFVGRHFTWSTGNCLATSDSRRLVARKGVYRLRGHALPPATYYLQVEYCHDSDLSKRGNYYCRGTNVKSVRIPRAGHPPPQRAR